MRRPLNVFYDDNELEPFGFAMRIMNIAFFQHFFQATLFEDYDIWELLDKMCLFQAQQQQQCYNIFLETSVLILKAETIMAHLNQEPSILKWSDCCTIKLSEHWSSAVSFLHFIFCPCKLLISPYRLEFFFLMQGMVEDDLPFVCLFFVLAWRLLWKTWKSN